MRTLMSYEKNKPIQLFIRRSLRYSWCNYLQFITRIYIISLGNFKQFILIWYLQTLDYDTIVLFLNLQVTIINLSVW